MHRRHLLHALALGGLTISSARLFATDGRGLGMEKPGQPVPSGANAERAEASERRGAPAVQASGARPRFLLVFLRGGYDATNLLIPTSSGFYYEQRPRIAIARPSATDVNAALPLNADWGLHPALRNSVYPLAQAGQARFIPFAGTEDLSRSHFETQDSIELGQPVGGSRDYNSGFLNRLAAELDAQQALSFTDQLPMAFRGPVRIANAGLRETARPAVEGKNRALIASMYQGQPLGASVQEGLALRDELARDLSPDRMKSMTDAAGRNAIPAKGFELEARRIATLMRGRFSLGFIDVGGWDTHVNQGGATGQLANRFEELGRGLAAIADELGPEVWRQTTMMVISEFGRTFRENGNRGTDHGHGSVYWLLGGGLASGGPVAGDQIALTATTLFQNRDYPVLNDYRAVLGGLWQRQFGLSNEALTRVFPSVRPKDLRLV
ncbi:DUF1501 domain-containing protein [Mitsuaria sp. GD03876]|uniref:DUF1501 domain-containing protein n=1 Tax=Mitsuaria sp. GD03876 TaxID=2975399 RepID=UPI00244AD8E8|nr:DUF1501 domain-containing protein [Mitsuaria sp. GD03876]MDH0864911.1 DUF1501 domain-containing protein [Mitsuaria sp. GD03876]